MRNEREEEEKDQNSSLLSLSVRETTEKENMEEGKRPSLSPPSHFLLTGGVGFCNSVRRCLLSDLSSWAPFSLTIRTNTSCVTDEYLSHRIGLIPFSKTGNGETVTLSKEGPCTVWAGDVVGHSFSPVHPNLPILKLGKGTCLDLTIHFDFQQARKHARYCPVSSVSLRIVDEEKTILSFSSNDERSPSSLLSEALDRLEERVDKALLSLANQPSSPPKSFC